LLKKARADVRRAKVELAHASRFVHRREQRGTVEGPQKDFDDALGSADVNEVVMSDCELQALLRCES
jgi:hypothetical protein